MCLQTTFCQRHKLEMAANVCPQGLNQSAATANPVWDGQSRPLDLDLGNLANGSSFHLQLRRATYSELEQIEPIPFPQRGKMKKNKKK